jgi:hypothetical protein
MPQAAGTFAEAAPCDCLPGAFRGWLTALNSGKSEGGTALSNGWRCYK